MFIVAKISRIINLFAFSLRTTFSHTNTFACLSAYKYSTSKRPFSSLSNKTGLQNIVCMIFCCSWAIHYCISNYKYSLIFQAKQPPYFVFFTKAKHFLKHALCQIREKTLFLKTYQFKKCTLFKIFCILA